MTGPVDLRRLRDELSRLRTPPGRGRAVLDREHLRLRRDLLDRLVGSQVDLEADVPLVLLPVRVEVRSTPDQTALRVRIFPDAVHVESLAEGLTPEEAAAGTAYWQAVWVSGDPAEAVAWTALTDAVGRRRVAWVAEVLRPTNIADRPTGEPVFPTPAERVDGPSVVRTLPDRFFVRVEQAGAQPLTVAGQVIPAEVPVGLTALDQLEPVVLDEDDLPPLDVTLRWLVDYDEAVALGLGVTVTLPIPGQDVDRIVVYGVRASLDATESAAALEAVFREHLYGDGAQFVPQGTPTNNTDTARTAWSRRILPGPPGLAPVPPPVPADANAAVTAAALGVDPAALARLAHADEAEQGRARAFAEALWETTWADALEVITEPGRNDPDHRLDLPILDAIHDHWVDHVRGRGPIPALRLGRQPYGLLPVLVTAAGVYEPRVGDRTETQIVPYLDGLRETWIEAATAVPTIMNGPLDTVIPAIFGTDAVLRGLRVRTNLSTAMMSMIINHQGPVDHITGQQTEGALVKLLYAVGSEHLEGDRLTGKYTRTLALPLVDPSDPAFVENLLEPAYVAKPVSVLQVLLAHADAVSRHSIDRVADPRVRAEGLVVAVQETSVEFDRDVVLAGLSAVEAEAWDDPVLLDATAQIDRGVDGVRLDRGRLADRNPFTALAAPTLAQQLAGDEPSLATLTQPEGIRLVGELFRAGRRRGLFRDALRVIAAITADEERRLLLAETLDCCSHRLDAWLTSVATRRLADLRATTPSGCHLGAYGVLNRVRLRAATPAGTVDGRAVVHDPGDGGYLHAPGLNHAATAGVLRSGRLTHRRGDPATEALDIDLSSDRVRDALDLLDGMRHGQSLGALLGYRLERRLHERSGVGLELDRFIYVLRTLAPLRTGKLTEPGTPVEESLAASDVVDGLRLMEVPVAAVVAKLTAGPDDQRYVEQWVSPQPGEADAVLAAIAELERTHDAVADLLLAESVHQLVCGNPARAAAALDVLGAGEATPPEPEVVLQPRAGVALRHRLAALIPAAAAGTAGWAGGPRAEAEPRLERWAQRVLGPADALALADGDARTLADAGLGALDVVYDADSDTAGTSTLATRVRAALPGLPDTLGPLAATWELAGLLRGLLATARPLDAADTGRRADVENPGQRTLDAAELVGRAAAALAALSAALGAGGDPSLLIAFGIRAPHPAGPALTPEEQAFTAEALRQEAKRRVAVARPLLTRAQDPQTSPKSAVGLAGKVLSTVFGTGFVAVPLLGPAAADVLAEASGPGGVTARPGADIRPWLARASALRPATSAYAELLLVREAHSAVGVPLRVVQTPPGGYPTWIGLPFPDAVPPTGPIDGLVAEVVGGPGANLSGPVAGLVFDEWTESVPRRLARTDPAQPAEPPTYVDVATTGIAVHANGPGARPAQAILLAITADGENWTGQRLVDVLDEAFALARLRGVTLPMIPYAGALLPALYFQDRSLQGEPYVEWRLLASEVFDAGHALPYLAVQQP